MSVRTAHLQIRLTPDQKARLERYARRAGQSVSEYVRARVLPKPRSRFDAIVDALAGAGEEDASYALAEMNDLLDGLTSGEFEDAVAEAEVTDLSPYLRNYVAAMVEQAAHRKGVSPPDWVRDVPPLEEPRFATSLRGLRWHLLTSAPIPFRRRNIFVDSGIGDRV